MPPVPRRARRQSGEKRPCAGAQTLTGEHFAGRNVRERGGTAYEFTDTAVRISRDGDTIEAPVRWAFGSGVQAITPVIEREGKWVEHRISWYREGNRLSLTPGHEPAPRLDTTESLGIEQSERNATRCFGCHTHSGTPGVTCQNCHGEGAEHRKTPARGNIRRDRSVALCASCHRSPDTEFASAMPELEDPRSIRFAPVGLLASRCYQKSGTLTCITCHDPHGEPRKQTVDATCQACHAAPAKNTHCPRTPGCAACHMKQSSPIPGLTFTDHRIR